MAFQERPYRGQLADDLLIADLLEAQPEHARHLADQPWRLSSPDAQSGRYARLWQEAGGQLAGFCVGWLDTVRRTGHVEPLGVRPGCTGMCLAQALLTELSSRLTAAGAGRVCVEANQANAAALRSYEAAGFRVTHTVRALGRTLCRPDQAGRR